MEKRKHRFNVVDVIVILLIAAAAVLLILGTRPKGETGRISLTYVMQTLQGSVDDMIPEEMASNVSAGDDVFDGETGRKIGKVASCDSRPAQYTSATTGNVSEVAGFKTLYITCEAQATEEGGSYSVGGVAVSTGKVYTLKFANFYCKAECISVDGAEEGTATGE